MTFWQSVLVFWTTMIVFFGPQIIGFLIWRKFDRWKWERPYKIHQKRISWRITDKFDTI